MPGEQLLETYALKRNTKENGGKQETGPPRYWHVNHRSSTADHFSEEPPEAEGACTCPYCNHGLGTVVKGWQMEMSKRAHLKECKPRASLTKAYRENEKMTTALPGAQTGRKLA